MSKSINLLPFFHNKHLVEVKRDALLFSLKREEKNDSERPSEKSTHPQHQIEWPEKGSTDQGDSKS
jgi:hypothetical protein